MFIPSSFRSPCTSLVEPLESRIAPAGVAPTVVGIDRQTPESLTTGALSVVFKVTFSEAVSGVTPDDFEVFTSGNAKASPTVAISPFSASEYLVSVSGLKGNGDVRLDLVDNDSINAPSIQTDASSGEVAGGALASRPLGGPGSFNGSFIGETYQLLQVMPAVQSIARVGPATTEATSVSWTVTFSEAVTGVDAADFKATFSGSLTSNATPAVTPVAASNGVAYTVSLGGLTGLGTVRLDLEESATSTTPIRDADGNPMQTSSVSFAGVSRQIVTPTVLDSAVGDFNGDGVPDFVITQTGSSPVQAIFGGAGATTTQQALTGTFGQVGAVAVADVNGDGNLDVIVADQKSASLENGYVNSTVSVLLGNGAGGFTSQRSVGPSISATDVAVGDVDGDGRQDIVTLDRFSGMTRVHVFRADGSGGFLAPTIASLPITSQGLTVADLNRDGRADIVAGNSDDTKLRVLNGAPGGVLAPVVEYSLATFAGEVAVADVNGDGFVDILSGSRGVPSAQTVVEVLLGKADGFNAATSFAVGTSVGTSAIAVADFDGDGKLDVAVAGTGLLADAPSGDVASLPASGIFGVTVLRGDGTGSFTTTGNLIPSGTDGATSELHVVDRNGDGRADLAGFDPSSAVNLLVNNGQVQFSGETITRAIAGPDLTVTAVTDSKASAAAGEKLTYSIRYSNLSDKPATGVRLTVPLDSNLEFSPSENAGWTQSGSTLVRVLTSNLGANASGNLTLKLKVKNVIAGSSFVAVTRATISSSSPGEDPNSANNSGEDLTLLDATADVGVTITDPGFAIGGRFGTYEITLKNPGSAALPGRLTVQLPADVDFNPMLNSGWTYDSQARTLSRFVEVAAGGAAQSVSYSVEFLGSKFGSILSTNASFAPLTSSPADSNPANNTATAETPVYSGLIVTAPGIAIGKRYAPPIVKVYDRQTGELAYEFNAYPEKVTVGRRQVEFRDSIRVAVGDLNGDGIDDIVTTTQTGTGRLRVFDGATGRRFSTGLFAEELAVFDGVRDRGAFVAVGDVDRSEQSQLREEGLAQQVIFSPVRPEIIVGSALGGGKVRVFADRDFNEDRKPDMIKEYVPFGANFRGGVRVASGDVDGLIQPTRPGEEAISQQIALFGEDDIVVAQGFLGGRVIAYKGATDTKIADFTVGVRGFRGGLSVAVGDVNNDGRADIITGRNTGRPSIVEVFDAASFAATVGVNGAPTGVAPLQLGKSINPFDIDPARPRSTFGVRVAVVDVNLDGVADIITSVGIKSASQVKIYGGTPDGTGNYTLLSDRTVTAFDKFLDVALWVAGSRNLSLLG